MCSKEFISALALNCDTLPLLTRMSKSFQGRETDFTIVEELVPQVGRLPLPLI